MADGQPSSGMSPGSSPFDQAKPLISFAIGRLAISLGVAAVAVLGGLWAMLSIMFAQVDSRFAQVDNRMTSIEPRLLAMDGRLADLVEKISTLDGYVRAKLDPADFQRLMRRTEVEPEQQPPPNDVPEPVRRVTGVEDLSKLIGQGRELVIKEGDAVKSLDVVNIRGTPDGRDGIVTVRLAEPAPEGEQAFDVSVSDLTLEGNYIVVRREA